MAYGHDPVEKGPIATFRSSDKDEMLRAQYLNLKHQNTECVYNIKKRIKNVGTITWVDLNVTCTTN